MGDMPEDRARRRQPGWRKAAMARGAFAILGAALGAVVA